MTVAITAVFALVAGSSPAGAGPADDRFDAITGPLGAFVERPEGFGLDAQKVLADVPALLAQVDGARARALVEALAKPRAATSSDADRQAATDLVAASFRAAGLEPAFQSVVLPATGKDEPNVYAEVAGTQCTDKVLVIGAHYDGVAPDVPAADDNASGVGGLFEIVRALRADPLPVTVRFASWSYEEEGLVGSRAMAARDQADGTDVVGAVSLEMIGYTEPDIDPLTGLPGTYLAMVADPTSSALSKAFAAAAYTYTPEFAAFGATIDPEVLPDILRSDHAAYLGAGYQGLLVTDTANFRNENYHRPTDTVDTLDWEYLRNSTRAALAGLATYGSSDQDQDGRADLCDPATIPPTPSSSTSTTPEPTSGPDGQTPGSGSAPAATGARPVAGLPRYTG